MGYATNLVSITVTGDASTDAGVIYTDQNNFALYVRNAGLGEGNDKGDLLMYVAKGNSKVTEFTVPDGVTYIGAYSFSGSAYIESVTVPEGITMLTGSAFSGMAALKKVTLPVSLKYIKAGILPDLDDNGDYYRRWGGLGTIPQVGPLPTATLLKRSISRSWSISSLSGTARSECLPCRRFLPRICKGNQKPCVQRRGRLLYR